MRRKCNSKAGSSKDPLSHPNEDVSGPKGRRAAVDLEKRRLWVLKGLQTFFAALHDHAKFGELRTKNSSIQYYCCATTMMDDTIKQLMMKNKRNEMTVN